MLVPRRYRYHGDRLVFPGPSGRSVVWAVEHLPTDRTPPFRSLPPIQNADWGGDGASSEPANGNMPTKETMVHLLLVKVQVYPDYNSPGKSPTLWQNYR